MNEFIAWDENMEDFMSFEEIEEQWESEGYHHAILSQDHYTTHNYIGKTDIEGNKIYADSSIVELSWKDYRSKTMKKTHGYFSENKEKHCLEFISLEDGKRVNFVEHIQFIILVKIIGTLQQNKELLDES